MKMLAQYLGGSHAYGLNTENSDLDVRGVFVNTEISKIIGLQRFEHFETEKDNDTKLKELRAYFNLLKKGNTEALECLFLDDKYYTVLTEEFKEIKKYQYHFIDSDNLHKCLLGYSYSELALANGSRTGLLGSKRKVSLEKYGFSPKNFVNYFRLLKTGEFFFLTGNYVVNWMDCDRDFAQKLLKIKTKPEEFCLVDLNKQAEEIRESMNKAFNKKSKIFKFDVDLANSLIYDIYMPVLENFKK